MISSIQALEAVAADATNAGMAQATEQQQNAFIDLLSQIDGSVSEVGDTLAAVAKGENQAPMHELMISLEVSRLQLQMLVEVRNRVVEGYQELTRMQV